MRDNQNAAERLVIAIAVCVAIYAFLWHFQHGDILLDGDAVAHINIARRVFDSRTPGPLQLGTVWLPLPHVLIMPFVISHWAWRTGVGGSVPSLAAFVFAVWGIFRLTARGLEAAGAGPGGTWAAGFAALVFGVNPNLLYLQATAMTESLYLALFIWAVFYFTEFAGAQGSGATAATQARSLTKCGVCLIGAMLTRYDGWFAAGVLACAVVVVAWRRAAERGSQAIVREKPEVVTRPLAHITKFLIMVAAVPALWFTYNGIIFGSPLDFATGRYSANGIAERIYAVNGFHYPGFHSLYTAALYFLKTVQLDMGTGGWGKMWLILGSAGLVLLLVRMPRLWPWLALGIPLPFYAVSIAYAGASIHVPSWWPFSYYNLRYGMQLLPALAVFSAALIYFAAEKLRGLWKAIPVVVLVGVLAGGYASTWTKPICRTEAQVNSRSRIALESGLAHVLTGLPPNSTFLMYTGAHVGALQTAGIPLHRVIYEGNHGSWKRPLDRFGLWEEALRDPAHYADYLVGFDEDEVTVSAQKHGLREVAIVETSGQPRAVVYATGR